MAPASMVSRLLIVSVGLVLLPTLMIPASRLPLALRMTSVPWSMVQVEPVLPVLLKVVVMVKVWLPLREAFSTL